MKFIRLLAALLLIGGSAYAQSPVQLPAGTALGNSTAARAPASPVTPSALIDRAISSTQGAVLTRNASAWIGLAPGTAGLPLLSGGAAANLAYGIPALAAGGTGANLTASNGGIFYSTGSVGAILSGSATARQMLQSGASAAPAWSTTTWPATTTINQLLYSSAANVISEITGANGAMLNTSSSGVPSLTQNPKVGGIGIGTGSFQIGGNTSGTAIITVQAAAGTPTLTLGTSSGTPAVTASSPLAITSATGNITCATCATTTNGGALSGTAPVAISAGGAVSITGAAGQVLAGAGPAFTATPTLGANGGTGGQLTLAGSSTGTGIIRVAAAAGSGIVFQLPSSNGSNTNVLSTDGAGVTSWIAAGAGTVTSLTCNGGLTGGTITMTGTCAVDIASAANFEAGTANKILDAAGVFTAETTTTYGTTTTLDFSTFINTRVTLTGNITTLTCSNMKASQSGTVTFVQDGTGSRTMVAGWCSALRWAGGTRGVLSTAASAIDALFYTCISTSVCYVSLAKAQAN